MGKREEMVELANGWRKLMFTCLRRSEEDRRELGDKIVSLCCNNVNRKLFTFPSFASLSLSLVYKSVSEISNLIQCQERD